jgi:hypothetical protein
MVISDGKVLAAQLGGNQDELAKDMREGLKDLLKLHNAEELSTLCETLEVEDYYANSKMANVEYILTNVIGLGDASKSSSDIDAAYSRVWRAIWDGIIIEYLRFIGKNLVKVRDNLRGAVLGHWRRKVIVKAEMNIDDGQLVFLKPADPWSRSAEEATTETDEKVLEFLEQLKGAEDDLKTAELNVRLNADSTL